MGVGRQSRRVCFGAKPDKGFLDLKSRRTRKWYGEANESWRRDPGEAVGGWSPGEAVGGWSPGERVGGWSPGERVGGRRAERELVAGRSRRGSWWLESREERVGGWTGEKAVVAGQERGEQQKLAWKNGGAVNTRHRNREARRQDRVQWRRVSRCLIPVALWNFR